jgi:hypothetical protein
MDFTAFAVLIFLWSRPTGKAAATSAIAEFCGAPPSLAQTMQTLVSNGLITGSDTTGYLIGASVTPDHIVSMASVLTEDEQMAIVELMASAGTVPTGETFLADSRAQGLAAADAARAAVLARVCAAVRGKNGDDRLVPGAIRSAHLNDNLAKAI